MSCRQNLNVPRMHTEKGLTAADFAAEQSHGDDCVPFLIPHPEGDKWEPGASMIDTILILSAAGLGLIIIATGLFRIATYLGWIS
ncbi:MAG TPA: hypothetical protein VLD59_08165 [Steroidobacteraceae bacterium]|nr:hypothetical protein [Steroidobacteraceae bacterium]